MNRTKKGFTIVELVVVMAILGILISLMVFGLSRTRKKGIISRAKSDMVAVGYAVIAYHDVHKDDSETNNQWPRNMYLADSSLKNKIPWEVAEEGYWSESEPLKSGIAFERFPCSPNYGENFNEVTQEADSGVGVDFLSQVSDGSRSNRQNACAVSAETSYVGINWAGMDKDFGLTASSAAFQDDGFLLLDVAKPIDASNPLPNDKGVAGDNYLYKGNFMLKMGGFDEQCTASGCNF